MNPPEQPIRIGTIAPNEQVYSIGGFINTNLLTIIELLIAHKKAYPRRTTITDDDILYINLQDQNQTPFLTSLSATFILELAERIKTIQSIWRFQQTNNTKDLPPTYNKLNKTARLLSKYHTHAELANLENPEQRVYKEADVIAILKTFNIEEPNWNR